jgi:hypothetical protein
VAGPDTKGIFTAPADTVWRTILLIGFIGGGGFGLAVYLNGKAISPPQVIMPSPAGAASHEVLAAQIQRIEVLVGDVKKQQADMATDIAVIKSQVTDLRAAKHR